MNGPMKALLAVSVAAFVGLPSHGLAQDEGRLVTIVLPGGTHVPFTLDVSAGGSSPGKPVVIYSDGTAYSVGMFVANVGGASTMIPFELIARVDLVAPGTATVWRATLRDGRIFDGAIHDGYGRLDINGVNQFGADEDMGSYPRDPARQPFIGVIFDPAAAATATQQSADRADIDSVALRNGDVLSGTILSTEFTIQASYGVLTFTKEQLQSITVENAAGRSDQVLLKVGDRVSGVLQNATIELALTSGATITLEKGNIASITFATD